MIGHNWAPTAFWRSWAKGGMGEVYKAATRS